MYKRICNVTSHYHIFQVCIYLCIANYSSKRGFTETICNLPCIRHCKAVLHVQNFIIPIINSSLNIKTSSQKLKTMRYESLVRYTCRVSWYFVVTRTPIWKEGFSCLHSNIWSFCTNVFDPSEHW